jgi:hypothetical protein
MSIAKMFKVIVTVNGAQHIHYYETFVQALAARSALFSMFSKNSIFNQLNGSQWRKYMQTHPEQNILHFQTCDFKTDSLKEKSFKLEKVKISAVLPPHIQHNVK